MSLAVFVIECVIFVAAFGALVFGMLLVNPLTFVSDYPPEIQEWYYASQQKEKSRRKLGCCRNHGLDMVKTGKETIENRDYSTYFSGYYFKSYTGTKNGNL